MIWFNEPETWKEEDGKLLVRAAASTDFWRKTHYGFIRDNGHFYYEWVSGSFSVETEFHADYASLYAQAGLMVRLDSAVWVKTGLELRLRRESGTVTVEYGGSQDSWIMLRTAYLSELPDLQVGRMVAAPDGPGFLATFTRYAVTRLGGA